MAHSMHLTALVYVSTAVRRLGAGELDAILAGARSFNESVNLTGALLHHDGSFFQYLEGSSSSVKRAYERILASSKHKCLIELMHGETQVRQFSQWHMAFTEAPASVLQTLAQSRWDLELSSVNGRRLKSAGLELLLAFWARTGATPFTSAP